MKKRIYLVAIFFIMTLLCFGKAIHLQDDTLKRKQKYKFSYLVIFYDAPPIATENIFIEPSRVESAVALPDSQSKAVCQLLKIDGIIVLKLKPFTKLLTLVEILNIYKVKPPHTSYLVKVDEDVIDYPETLLISQNQIESVKMIKDTTGIFINIILKGYYEIKKEHEKGSTRVQ